MPLPAALAARLAKRGIISKKSAQQQTGKYKILANDIYLRKRPAKIFRKLECILLAGNYNYFEKLH